jgi:LEA14-like dessication related protein
MKKNERLIIYAGAAFVAYWFYSKARALQGLIFSPGPINGITITGGAPVLSLNVGVQNTNSASLRIDSLAANVISNGTLIGNAYNFTPVEIPANSAVFMPVLLKLETIGIVNDIITAIQYGNPISNIKINGSVNVNGIQLPLSVNFG